MHKGRKKYLDIIRIVAALMVVMIHVTGQHLEEMQIGSSLWFSTMFLNCLVNSAVHLFIMISGVVMLDPDRHFKRHYFQKSAIRLIVLYLAWGLIYACSNSSIFTNGTANVDIQEFAIMVVRGEYHMWYLPMIAGIYLITPILRKITEGNNMNLVKWFNGLFLVFYVCRVTLNLYMPYGTPIYLLLNLIPVEVTSGYVGYFFLGYYLDKKEFSPSVERLWVILGIIAIGFTFWFDTHMSIETGKLYTLLQGLMYLPSYIEGISIFMLIKMVFKKDSYSSKKIVFLSEVTLGVYLIHPLILQQLSNYGMNALTLGVLPLWLMVVFISFVVSGIMIMIPLVNKIV